MVISGCVKHAAGMMSMFLMADMTLMRHRVQGSFTIVITDTVQVGHDVGSFRVGKVKDIEATVGFDIHCFEAPCLWNRVRSRLQP